MATTVTSMAAMHKNVHQRAGQQKQKRQYAQKVGPMLAQQKVRCYRPEDEQTDGISGAPEGRCVHLACLLIVMVFVVDLKLLGLNCLNWVNRLVFRLAPGN